MHELNLGLMQVYEPETPYDNMQVCGQSPFYVMHACGQTLLDLSCMLVAKFLYDTMHVCALMTLCMFVANMLA